MALRKQDLATDLERRAVRAGLVPEVDAVLGLGEDKAAAIVDAFDTFVALPLRAGLRRLSGRQLANRNPMIYTSRGVTSAAAWVDAVLADKETSAVEGLLGMFQEEVARIASGGVKAGGADLYFERDGVVHLFALQAAPSTKNSAGRRGDVQRLREVATELRAQRRHVDTFIGVMNGRSSSRATSRSSDIAVPASDEFWELISRIPDFRVRLLRASVILARLATSASDNEVERIHEEALRLYADSEGNLDVAALANPPSARDFGAT